jgi:hypothetical protein
VLFACPEETYGLLLRGEKVVPMVACLYIQASFLIPGIRFSNRHVRNCHQLAESGVISSTDIEQSTV